MSDDAAHNSNKPSESSSRSSVFGAFAIANTAAGAIGIGLGVVALATTAAVALPVAAVVAGVGAIATGIVSFFGWLFS